MSTNKQTEDLGLKAVLAYEKKNRRPNCKRVHKCGYDLESTGKNGERHIEVKSTSKDHFTRRWLEQLEYDKLRSDKKFWLYLVTNAEGAPKVHPYNRKKLMARFDKAILQYVFVFQKSDF